MATVMPIDPADSPRLVLQGRIVTMDAQSRVIAAGRVYAHQGALVAVQDAAAPVPQGFEAVPVVDTGGTIFPGLIDLHNHMPYNVLPLWQVPQRFGNRGQWGRHAEYRANVSVPMRTLAATDELLAAICRYTETKVLLGGTTTTQGIALANHAGIRRFFRGVVRNVENTDDLAFPEASTRVPDVEAGDAKAFLTRLRREKTCYLLHLSEGLDATARAAFTSLEFAPGEWAITPSLCGIHAAALQAADFQRLASMGGSMVWSPFSNLLLYGGTADVAAAKASGVPIALGCDWSPTGSRNLLNELKVAFLHCEPAGIFSARELIELVTRWPAEMLEWAKAGSLQAGKAADLLVCDGTAADPYEQLVFAKESDLSLVMINGIGRVGTPALMQALGLTGERIRVGGSPRVLYLAHPSADPLLRGLGLADARDALQAALQRLPVLARRAERPVRTSAAIRAAGAGDGWHLVLDEIAGTGVDLRPALPERGASGRPLRAAAQMRPLFPFGAKSLSSLARPVAIDPLTVADDVESYLDAIDLQRNLPASIKDPLRGLWL